MTALVLARSIYQSRGRYSEAGHMMYVHDPSLTKLAADVRKFVATDR